MKNLIVGADPWGKDLKNAVLRHLQQKGCSVVDVNSGMASENYYDVACQASARIQAKEADGAILFCGTGMGMSIVCNKHQGIIASVVETPWAAKMARAVNDANVLCMGGMNVKPEAAIEAVDNFLSTNLGDGLAEFLPFLQEATRQVACIDQKCRT
jgi:ribose 5-phosphate isomerase B